MFYYSRQIVYIDFIEAGHKIRNAGFLKLEELEGEVKWNIRIKGIHEAENGFYEIRDETGSMVDKLLLEHGEGNYTRQSARGTMTRGGRPWEEICGIRIALSAGKSLEGNWHRKMAMSGEKGVSVNMDGTVDESTGREKRAPFRKTSPDFPARRKTAYEDARMEAGREAKGDGKPAESSAGKEEQWSQEAPGRDRRWSQEATAQEEWVTARQEEKQKAADGQKTRGPLIREGMQAATLRQGAGGENNRGEALKAAGIGEKEFGLSEGKAGKDGGDTLPSRDELYEDKWEQLQHMYRTVHPFGDDRAFLSIAPKDFVILEKEFQKMVHNSFLLHGYYNYRHIILGKISQGGEEAFYLGVPGVYYDREKMAAEMFGFEAFEGKYAPAKQGSFGYYMKRVRI